MKFAYVLGIVVAVVLHGGFLLFGGLLLPEAKPDLGVTREVELLSEIEADRKEEKEPEPVPDELKTQQDAPPDSAVLLANLDQPPPDDAPALDAASLAAIEAALHGLGGGDFGFAMDFASGGVIGGTGSTNAIQQQFDDAFSLSEIDQKPRPVFQPSPTYPAELRGKKNQGLVSVLLVIDATGKVVSQRIEHSNHAAFNKPTLDAVKRWKFEPAVKSGERVACRMRYPIRFQPN